MGLMCYVQAQSQELNREQAKDILSKIDNIIPLAQNGYRYNIQNADALQKSGLLVITARTTVGIVTETSVTLTRAGEKLIEKAELIGNPVDGFMLAVWYRHPPRFVVDEITGITGTAPDKTVEFTAHFDFADTGVNQDVARASGNGFLLKDQSVKFRLYDDGWRPVRDGRQSTLPAFEIVPRESPSSVSSASGEPSQSHTSGGGLYLRHSDGTKTALAQENASLKWGFGAKKVVEVSGSKSNTRFAQHDTNSFLVSTPALVPSNTCKVYFFEVKKDKRTAIINKTGTGCVTASFGSDGQLLKITSELDLPPGEYAFGPSDPRVQSGGGGMITVVTFGIDPSR
jgi:hypothetical protein